MKLTTKTAKIKQQKIIDDARKKLVNDRQLIKEEIKKRATGGCGMKPPTLKTKQQLIEEATEKFDNQRARQADHRARHDAWTLEVNQNPNADGWRRLCEILENDMTDKRILSSPGASEVVGLFHEIAADSWTCGDAIQALRVLAPILAGDQLRDNTGRHNGGKSMKQIKEAHIEHLTQPVIDILKNPKTSDWGDPEIARWLMKPERALHKFKDKKLKDKELTVKTMTNRVKEIRAAYKASI
jgi:hypothetical protein